MCGAAPSLPPAGAGLRRRPARGRAHDLPLPLRHLRPGPLLAVSACGALMRCAALRAEARPRAARRRAHARARALLPRLGLSLSAPAPRRWSAIRVSLCKSVLCGAFVRARRALDGQKRRCSGAGRRLLPEVPVLPAHLAAHRAAQAGDAPIDYCGERVADPASQSFPYTPAPRARRTAPAPPPRERRGAPWPWAQTERAVSAAVMHPPARGLTPRAGAGWVKVLRF